MNEPTTPPAPAVAEFRIRMELPNGKIDLSVPENLELAWVMLSKATDLFVRMVLKKQSGRKVKTLDELGGVIDA